MEANVQAKKCSCCGREKPVSEFRKDGRAADGYSKVCNVCRTERRITAPGANSRITPVFHEELSQYPPRALMEHLSALCYKGSLQIPHNMTL